MQTHWAARFAWLHTSYYAPRLPISPRAQFKEHQPRRVSLKPSPELLRCRAGAIPDEQRDGSLPVKLVAVAEASGQRKTRWLWQAQRVSPSRVKFVSRMPVRTCASSAQRGHFASPISARAKFFRRGAAHRGDGTPRRRGTWPKCKSPATRGERVPASLLSGFWMACSFGKVPCLAPFLRRHGPHSAGAGAAPLRSLVHHASRAVGSVAARREVHGAAHAGDDVCLFSRAESQPIRCAHGPRTLPRIARAGKAKMI